MQALIEFPQFREEAFAMNWLPHDFGTWGFILGVLALILAIPLGIASNLLAPRLQSWWAARSIASLQRTVSKLEEELAASEANPFSYFERAALRAVDRVAWMVMIATQTILGAMILLAGAWMNITGREPERIFPIMLMGWVVCKLIMLALVHAKNSSVIERGDEEGRGALRSTIANLKAKLAKAS